MNPFEPPHADQPEVQRARHDFPQEQFGDRAFWPGVSVLGLVVLVALWFVGSFWLVVFGMFIVVYGLWGWARELLARSR